MEAHRKCTNKPQVGEGLRAPSRPDFKARALSAKHEERQCRNGRRQKYDLGATAKYNPDPCRSVSTESLLGAEFI